MEQDDDGVTPTMQEKSAIPTPTRSMNDDLLILMTEKAQREEAGHNTANSNINISIGGLLTN